MADTEAHDQFRTARNCLIDGTEAAEKAFAAIHTNSQIAIGVNLSVELDDLVEEGRHDGQQWVITGSVRIVLRDNNPSKERWIGNPIKGDEDE